MKKMIRKLKKNGTMKENLLALAEESSELSNASLKMCRANNLINHPTPLTKEEAFENLLFEAADVLNCLEILGIYINSDTIVKKRKAKLKRCIKRLEQINS